MQISLKDEAFKVLQLSLEEKTEEFQELIASLKQEQVNFLDPIVPKLYVDFQSVECLRQHVRIVIIYRAWNG